MKKIISAIILCLIFVPIAQAATIASLNVTTFQMNETKELAQIFIAATADGEITAANGIRIFMNPEAQMLWDNVTTLYASGTAVTSGKVPATITPTYLNAHSVLYIPVNLDFISGENITITGMKLRAYHRSFSGKFLQLDVNGDGVGDATDVNKIEVQGTYGGDFSAPFPPTDYSVVLSPDLSKVSITWKNPPDFDLKGCSIDRTRVRDGNTQQVSVLIDSTSGSYTDTDISMWDKLTYSLTCSDGRNNSDPLIQTVDVKTAAVTTPVTTTPVVTTPTTTTTTTEQTELDQLNRLYSYYKVRYAIKCRAGVSANDSACLWAKIDIVYTQDKISKTDVKASLSAKEIGYIQSGIRWAQDRYQTKCVDAATPDKTCDALGQSLKRADYFIK